MDPDNILMDASVFSSTSLDKRTRDESVISKTMKNLDVIFIPLDLNRNSFEETMEYRAFVNKQQRFIKDVYPIPESHFIFDTYTLDLPTLTVGPIFSKRLGLMNELAYVSVIEGGSKMVAILPDSMDWWEPEVWGYSTYYMRAGIKYIDYFLPYNTRAVLVRYGANEGVSAHEIGHTLGLNRYRGEEEYQTHAFYGKQVEGLIEKDGKIYNITNVNELQTALRAANGAPADRVFCFMGSNEATQAQRQLGVWICDETMHDLFKFLKDPPDEHILYVAGTIYQNDTIKFDRWYQTVGLPDPQDTGDYIAQCVSGSGTVLYSTGFGVSDQEFLPFGFIIPYQDGVSEIVFKHGDVELGRRSPSPNKPTVSLSPVSAQGDQASISWSPTDGDGDTLASSVLYSNDNGVTWSMVALHTGGNSYTLDMAGLPGGISCLVKVVVNDGFNTVEEVSNPFNVASKVPECMILTPADGSKFGTGAEVSLSGVSYDPEDDDLLVEWISDIDGNLGTGDTINSLSLSNGHHTITLKTTDSSGLSSTDQVTLTIDDAVTKVADHFLCKSISEDGSPNDIKTSFWSDETIISLVRVANAVPGDTINWLFQGKGITQKYNYTIKNMGDTGAYAALNLSMFNVEDVLGTWTVSVGINGDEVLTSNLVVEERQEPLTGFLWWGGFIGLAIIVGLSAGGYMLLKRRKPRDQSHLPQPTRTQGQVQKFCTECGNQTTWIEQYQLWYCYNCEKYLD